MSSVALTATHDVLYRRAVLDDLESKPYTARFERYLSLRAIQRRINSDLVAGFSKAAIEHSARRLGLWTRGALVVESEEDFDVLCDFCIYDGDSAGKNSVSASCSAEFAMMPQAP